MRRSMRVGGLKTANGFQVCRRKLKDERWLARRDSALLNVMVVCAH